MAHSPPASPELNFILSKPFPLTENYLSDSRKRARKEINSSTLRNLSVKVAYKQQTPPTSGPDSSSSDNSSSDSSSSDGSSSNHSVGRSCSPDFSYNVRRILPSDMKQIAHIDYITNKDTPLSLGWHHMPKEGQRFIQDRLKWMSGQLNYLCLVAALDVAYEGQEGEEFEKVEMTDTKVMGFIIWRTGPDTEFFSETDGFWGVEDGQKPRRFLDWYFDGVEERWMELRAKIHWPEACEIMSLAVAPEYQRKGIGTTILKEIVELLDDCEQECHVRSSVKGKSMFEKSGWKVLGEHRPNLQKWGWTGEESVHFYMKRQRRVSKGVDRRRAVRYLGGVVPPSHLLSQSPEQQGPLDEELQ
ncbi:hypothetical protein BJ878DRAFT_18240 [Calycina marina]|uniref:N-acetyltransferase domain-containing protein n=1 Tax=Calycina marina TaxID=1763456 RepID=A0A9P7YUB6_9HELO|nr:hypothetical protein BJ878DRAFT_18240 [Calycina marina]